MKKILKSESETIEEGRAFGLTLKPGDIVVLKGDLGAGKTTFTKGVALALDISDTVVSPTFTIHNEYKGDITLNHFDFYRIENENEAVNIGVEDIFYTTGISIIEWGENINGLIPKNAKIVSIKKIDDKTREIEI